MRRIGLLLAGGAVGAAGCFAPFSWPAERRPDESMSAVAAAVAVETDHLAKAADCLDRGDDDGALPHLTAHVSAHPDAVMVRAYLAELLVRVGRPADARPEFERVVADAQRETGPARGHLAHCHTRLMEIASAESDGYAEHLHRGIGLLMLVKKWNADPECGDAVASEQTLAKAAKALRAAADERPGDVRANLYLAEVYDRLAQPAAARAARRAAKAGLPDPALTADERDRLIAAGF